MFRTLVISLFVYLFCTEVHVTSRAVDEVHSKSPLELLRTGNLLNLKPIQAILVNKTVFPFLNECYLEDCCLKNEQLLCPFYSEMVMHLSESKQLDKFTTEKLHSLQSVEENFDGKEVTEFCKHLVSTAPKSTNKKPGTINVSSAFQDRDYCAAVCFNQIFSQYYNRVSFKVKPICKIISQISDIIAKDYVVSQGNVNNLTKEMQIPSNNNLSQNINDLATASKPKVTAATSEPEEKIIQKVPPINKPVPLLPLITNEQIKPRKEEPNPMKNEESISKIDLVKPEVKIKNITQGSNTSIPTEKSTVTNNKTQTADKVTVGSVSVQSEKLPAEEAKEGKEGDVNNEKGSYSQQINDNPEMSLDDQDDIFQDNQKSDPILNYNEDDNGIEEIRPPQADTKQTQKEPPLEEIIDANLRDISQKTGVGVSANYIPASDPFYEEAGSNFFTYFLGGMLACIVLYVLYHNKTKVLALILEGRRSQKGRGGRRKHTAQYRKLDTNLEEAITSSPDSRSTQIIY